MSPPPSEPACDLAVWTGWVARHRGPAVDRSGRLIRRYILWNANWSCTGSGVASPVVSNTVADSVTM